MGIRSSEGGRIVQELRHNSDVRPAFDSKSVVASLPALPGVYQMRGTQGEVLYVGKAKDLRRRVGSYFARPAQSARLAALLARVAAIDVTVTRSEDEALLLENNLIKSLAPRYNIVFRDDKSYPYLVLSGHRFPRLSFRRGALAPGDRRFGPFPHAQAVREAIQLLQRVFRLRTCEDTVFRHRTRPCLLYQIRRCSAPCVGRIGEAEYARDVRDAILFLEGREEALIAQLDARMAEVSAAQRYEEAAVYRDRLRALARVQTRQYVESERPVEADVLGCAVAEGMACVNLVMIRGGKHIGDRCFFPQNAAGATAQEVLAAFVAQHYAAQPRPPLVLASHAVERGVIVPAQGERREWLRMATENARHALARKRAERGTQQERVEALREALGLPEAPRRIECFDVSHTYGEAAVAACVVYDQQAMQKAEYRRYNVRRAAAADDYAALGETIRRRYARLAEQGGCLPDLLLIDGGRGQVNAARAALAELGLHGVTVIGVAKASDRRRGGERLVLCREHRPLKLSPEHPALHLVQAIRDEAHRFAVAGHRARRSRARTDSMLHEIPGVGARRRQRLLARFGGLQGVAAAAVEELARVPGVSRALAERIWRHLHPA